MLDSIRLVTFDGFPTLIDPALSVRHKRVEPYSDTNAVSSLAQMTLIGCVSTASHDEHLQLQRALGLFWDVLLTGQELGNSGAPFDKGNGAYRRILDLHSLRPEHWLHVSAFLPADATWAKEIGIRTCYVPRPGGLSPVDVESLAPDFVMSDLHQLAVALQKVKHGPRRYRVRALCNSEETAQRFLAWMRYEHGSDLLKMVGCIEYRAYQISETEVHNEYMFTSRALLARYLSGPAAQLRAKGKEMFSEEEITYTRDESDLMASGISRRTRDFA